jgi:hypothetical protein
MSPAPVRFRDPRSTPYDHLDVILVRCPRCARPARVVRAPDARPDLFPARRLVCTACGLAKSSDGRSVAFWRSSHGPAEDPFFGVPLWLQTATRHGRLWAYGPGHLEEIRRFVAAGLREHAPWYETGRKMTLVARLPAWIKSARNRDEVLRAAGRLRASLITAG